MKDSIILEKSFNFAVRIYRLSKYLQEKREFYLADQIMRSGMSVSANMQEANVGQTTKDFYSKLSIALKEARETEFWLKVLKEVGLVAENEYISIYNDCLELIKMISKSRKTTKENMRRNKKTKSKDLTNALLN
jgi:four helix bundle protein